MQQPGFGENRHAARACRSPDPLKGQPCGWIKPRRVIHAYSEDSCQFRSDHVAVLARFNTRRALAMLADGASVADVCHKPDIKFTIEPDRALADRLNPARDDWQQIYQLLKAQKTSIQSDSGDGSVFMVAGA